MVALVLSPPHKRFKYKSPLTLLFLLSLLVVLTLVAASSFFLRPSMEIDIKEKVVDKIEEKGHLGINVHVSGRDVTLKGIVKTEEESSKLESISRKVQGVHEINNKLIIKNKND